MCYGKNVLVELKIIVSYVSSTQIIEINLSTKRNGGLGFIRFKDINTTLLVKIRLEDDYKGSLHLD